MTRETYSYSQKEKFEIFRTYEESWPREYSTEKTYKKKDGKGLKDINCNKGQAVETYHCQEGIYYITEQVQTTG